MKRFGLGNFSRQLIFITISVIKIESRVDVLNEIIQFIVL